MEKPQPSHKKGNISPAWDRVGDVRLQGGDAAGSSGPLHQTGALLLADTDTGMLRCVQRHLTSSTFIYLPGSTLALEMRQVLILRNTTERD